MEFLDGSLRPRNLFELQIALSANLLTALAIAAESQEYAGQMEELAMIDPLTGLSSRHALDAEIERLEASRDRGKLKSNLIVIQLDLDNLKSINDGGGHEAGDSALRLFGEALKERARKEDTTARLGGDEFIMLLTDVVPEQAYKITLDIQGLVDESHGNLTFSGGIAEVQSSETIYEAMERADDALFTAKRHGRNCVTIAP